MENFCIVFDETDFHEEEFFIFLISELSNKRTQKSYLLDSTIGLLSATATTVHQLQDLEKVYSSFKVFSTDGTAYNVLAGKKAKRYVLKNGT